MAEKIRKYSRVFGWTIVRALAYGLIVCSLAILLFPPKTAPLVPSAWARPLPSAPVLSREAAAAAAGKFQKILDSSDRGESFGTVRLSETEINSYIHYNLAQDIPPGISNISLKLEPGRTHGTAQVDFDRLREGMKTPPNPLVALFLKGVHELGVEGTISGANGSGEFHLESVSLDNVTLPEMVVDYLIDYYLRTRYPGVAINQPFNLPLSIDQLVVETGSVRLTSRTMSAMNRETLQSGILPLFH